MDNRKRLADRYVYLCDGMIIICKMSKKGGVGLVSGGGQDLKLRDKHLIRRVDVVDREDTDDLKFTFELVPRDQVRNWFLFNFKIKKHFVLSFSSISKSNMFIFT
jgi:hypothetical protein